MGKGSTHIYSVSQADVDPASIAIDAAGTVDVTVTGVAIGDIVLGCSHSQLSTQTATIVGNVSAADTVRCVIFNKTGGALDLVAGTMRVAVLKAV